MLYAIRAVTVLHAATGISPSDDPDKVRCTYTSSISARYITDCIVQQSAILSRHTLHPRAGGGEGGLHVEDPKHVRRFAREDSIQIQIR